MLFLVGCVAGNSQDFGSVITGTDISSIEDGSAVGEYARLCLPQNYSMTQAIEFARQQGWQDASDSELQNIGLGNLRRKILEIPGGGGRYRETQAILKFNGQDENILANMMERYDRHGKLVRTDCTIYTTQQNYLPICTAIGKLLKRPPDSNQKFQRSDSQFIRWNVIIANKPASVRCDGIGAKTATDEQKFAGTAISMVVDQSVVLPVLPNKANSNIDNKN
ncbi:MAG: hypothetical protein L3J32_00310 [Rhizobiaceae bacterium]|nr:hypothetical protein [Rhizobiaceae bacterium]